MTLENATVEYLEQGFSIIPIRNGSKKPLIKWTPYQDTQATPNEVEEWFEKWPDAQIALVTGEVSGVGVVDADSKAGIEWIKKNLPRTSVYQKTYKGLHAFYKSNGKTIKNKVRITDGVDVRGDGGYVLISPSAHPNGGKYEFVFPSEGQGWDDLTLFPYEILNNKKMTKQTPVTSAPVERGKRNNTLARITGKYINRGFTNDEILDLCLGWNCRCPEPQSIKDVETTVNSIIKTHERNYLNGNPNHEEKKRIKFSIV